MTNNHSGRIVDDAEAPGPEVKAEIHVLVRGCRRAVVEPTDLEKGIFAQHQAHTGAVVDLTRIVVSWSLGVVAKTNEPRGAVGIDERPRLLQPPVRGQNLRAGRADVVVRGEGLEESTQPARADLDVVTQEDEILSAGALGGDVAPNRKPRFFSCSR